MITIAIGVFLGVLALLLLPVWLPVVLGLLGIGLVGIIGLMVVGAIVGFLKPQPTWTPQKPASVAERIIKPGDSDFNPRWNAGKAYPEPRSPQGTLSYHDLPDAPASYDKIA